jgi:outer membrane protein assembly factor BamB
MMVDTLSDVTGDGKPEVVVSSWENAVTVLSGADGSLVWKTTVPDLYGNGGDVWSARAIDDLDGDGLQDVIAGSFNNHVYAMSGVDGTIRWAFNTPGNRVYTVMPVADLNRDGRPDVAVGTQETVDLSDVVFVLSGEPPLFADGFESGDTGAWTTPAP